MRGLNENIKCGNIRELNENIEVKNVRGRHLLSTPVADSPSSNTPVQVVVPTKLVINIKSFGDENRDFHHTQSLQV